MPARAGSDASSSMVYALVAFIVLFLAAAVFSVTMYMKNEQYLNEANAATDRLAALATDSQYNTVKSLSEPRAGRTALGQIMDDITALAQLIAGEELGKISAVDARDRVTRMMDPMWPDIQNALVGMETEEETTAEVSASLGLKKILEMMIAQINAGKEGIKDLSDQMTNLLQAHQQQIEEREKRIGALEGELQKASVVTQTGETNYQQLKEKLTGEYEKIIANLDSRYSEAQNQVKNAREENDKLKGEITEFQKEVKNLKDRLQKLSPQPETEMAALEPDGYVVSVVPREKLAYINLAKNDHIYRGLTFSVYDKYQTIPKTGQGKATLEVIEIMDTISKCRITDSDATNPIREGDIIANLVWSKDKKYLFCVAGDFDFNGDGKMDTDGRDRIQKLIESWGGKVTYTLTVDTDFLVLGQTPLLPERSGEEDGLDNTKEYQDQKKALESYSEVREDAVALGVPTFNLSRFLYFIGYYQQAKGIQ